ncbi:phosphoenolpyruvate--protein phosphotransferase [Cohnella thailandensis]|uniref:Phosphoenolpyruvate-protein phosphotransferase n=1 Tax=Cohnella thailandensis TaxID=557557 RepID=A0A841SR49_9BACL|nr:phosphoenolpyruvate--protein phosphotransferase [Cohnella thailandensis]MBB6633682.1 phosphoenolpyruvate--protein phosphotransferase [Cohnella thailandensis]MBP1976467.1 phosphotransferase system enzyme I (PtsI) [Cohnella thailandensis]
MAKILTGIAASPGIAIAKAFRFGHAAPTPERKTIADSETEAEAARFREAVRLAQGEIEEIRAQTERRLGAQKAEIFEAHLMLLEDPDLVDVTLDKIAEEKINAEYALYEVTNAVVDMLQEMEDELLRERAADVKDVSGRVMGHLIGQPYASLSGLSEESVVIAEDLTPSDTAQLDLEYALGFATAVGSRTSHSAIMARSLELPAIVGIGAEAASIPTGTVVILDAAEGKLIVDPSEEELREYRGKKAAYEERRAKLKQLSGQPSVSADGVRLELAANIGSVEDLAKVLENGADGVGLFRTEFLYMGRSSFPSEEEQYRIYKHVLEKMNGKRVVIRTLDIGGDKELPYLELPKESNPFLGLRALRLCLDRQDLFRTQLRALLRASTAGKLNVMFPMIAVLSELREAKRIMEEEREKLLREGTPVSDSIEVGMMIEIPAAALNADSFAKEVDFFSIGTNDLIQYTMAADRMNEAVAYLYQPYHPSILRLIGMVIRAANRAGKWTGMCGEMAGDPTAIPLLLGMGLNEFSMSAGSVLPARELVGQLSKREWAAFAEEALAMGSQEEVKQFVEDKRRFD